MAFIASLVVGANNATTLNGASTGLSTSPDRARFLALHRSAGAIIIGKESAKAEDYSKTSVPIFIFSRSREKLSLIHPWMQQITVGEDLAEITRGIGQRIDGDVVIEAGHTLLTALVAAGVIDFMQLSISPLDGDGDYIDLEKMMNNFDVESEEVIEGTRLLQCRYNGNATNS